MKNEYQKRKRKYKKMQDQRGTKHKTREERDENKDKDDCKRFMIRETERSKNTPWKKIEEWWQYKNKYLSKKDENRKK